MAIKLFYNTRHDQLATEVQGWLAGAPAIRVTGMSADSNSYGHAVTLIYEPADQPRQYQFGAFFGSHGFTGPKVQSVEAEASAWMAADWQPVHVAHSMNDYGLFLALLLEA